MSVFRKQTSRKGNLMYEEVLQKNFEVIETFLKKFHQIFSKQDQFEQQLNKFNQKFTEYDEVLDEFRQEQKLNLVLLQKKVSNMKNSGRESHRSSNRFSKISLPVFDSSESAETNKSKFLLQKDYTTLKFDSIQAENQINIESKHMKKQAQNSGIPLKQFEEVKESISSMKESLTQMKDKVNFLSAYTSSISIQESKMKSQSLKKDIIQSLGNEFRTKIEKEIQNQTIETEKIFLQQINNLAVKFTNELTSNFDARHEKMVEEITKLEDKFCTHQQVENLKVELQKDMKKLANECIQIFASKDETKRSLNLFDRKVKLIETSVKQLLGNSGEERGPVEAMRSSFQVNSVYNQQTPTKQSSWFKQRKSHSQTIKNRNDSANITLGDNQKQNMTKSRKTCRKGYELSQGSLFTSKVSKEFMKNFGITQNKLLKTKCQPKRQKHFIDPSRTQQTILKPNILLRQSMESC